MRSIVTHLTGRNAAWSSLLMAGLALPLGGCEALEPPEATPVPEPGAPPQTPSEPMVPPAIPARPAPGDTGTPSADTPVQTPPSTTEPQAQP